MTSALSQLLNWLKVACVIPTLLDYTLKWEVLNPELTGCWPTSVGKKTTTYLIFLSNLQARSLSVYKSNLKITQISQLGMTWWSDFDLSVTLRGHWHVLLLAQGRGNLKHSVAMKCFSDVVKLLLVGWLTFDELSSNFDLTAELLS